MARRPRVPGALALCAALVGCGTSRPSPSPRGDAAGPTTTTATATPVTSTGVAPSARPLNADACQPTLPEPPAAAAAAGPAYVLVDHVGVLRIDEGKVEMVLKLPSDSSSWSANMASGPAGELWVSTWTGVNVIEPKGAARNVRAVKDGPLYEHLAVRSPKDVWAITSDIEWAIVRYDGAQWKPVRKRSQFRGKYEDNKIITLKATSDAIWVSCWNGIWRGVGDQWQKVEMPDKYDGLLDLYVFRDQLIAGNYDGYFIREGTGWKRLSWPAHTNTNRAVGDIGLVASPSATDPTVLLKSVVGDSCTAKSDAMRGAHINDIAVDRSGRVWVATDHALAVLDRNGRLLQEWTPGTLDGLVGEAQSVVVIGAGPAALPAPQAARTWEIIGRLEVYKSSTPLANAELELCSGIKCAGAAFAKKARSGADGSFRFTDVPEGELRLHVKPPASEEGCDGLFSVMGDTIVPSRDCKAAPGNSAPRVCDLGTLRQCLPFEMPPPIP